MTFPNFEMLFLFFPIFYFSYLYPRQTAHTIRETFICLNEFGEYLNRGIYPHLYEVLDDKDDDDDDDDDDDAEDKIIKPLVKYEDRYIDDIEKLNKEFQLTEEEVTLETDLINKLFREAKDAILKEIYELNEQKGEMEHEIYDLDSGSDNEERKILMKCIDDLNKNISEKTEMIETKKGMDELMNAAELEARKKTIYNRLHKIKNSYVMDKTPLGNVLMKYNCDKESFEYYSDNSIPYRFLETVGRKFVKSFDCRPIFINMKDELKLCEEKYEKNKREKELLIKEKMENKQPIEQKKNVFAKFKTYNKDTGSGKVNMGAAPPKNSIPNKQINSNSETNEKLLLKEKANRYTYEGKLSNFSFLKKIDRKVVDKKYAMTFADFKRMQKEKEKEKIA